MVPLATPYQFNEPLSRDPVPIMRNTCFPEPSLKERLAKLVFTLFLIFYTTDLIKKEKSDLI